MMPLNWTIAVAEVSGGKHTLTREATLAECSAVAPELGLLGCERLVARYTLNPVGGGRYKLAGQCEASITQACIVSFEPIPAKLELPFDVEFRPDADAAIVLSEDEAEVLTLPEIEPIPHGQLEIGRIVFETLAAGLDPYPRKPDATFNWQDPNVATSPANPFAALAKLKPKV
jgi:hypothetical protein